jgi:hypothetical protein
MWNPAACGDHPQRGTLFRLYVQPLAPLIAARDLCELDTRWKRDDRLTVQESLLALALLLKGATFSTPTLGIGVLGFEESVNHRPSRRFFDFRSAVATYWNVLAVNVRLADTVSLGGSAALCHRWDEQANRVLGDAYSFGVLLKPDPRMNVGLTYFDLSRDVADSRSHLERIGDQTVNAGFSYYPDDKTVLCLDLRNLNDEEREAAREIHLGVERIVLNYCALRIGYFRRKLSNPADHVFTTGIGIARSEHMLARGRPASRLEVLSYAFIREECTAPGGPRQGSQNWHALSVLLRI